MQLFQQALDAQKRGRFKEAESLYRKIISNEPGNFDAIHMLAIVSSELGKVSEAEALFLAAVSIDTKYPPLFHNFGLFLAKRGRYEDSVKRFNEALKLSNNYAPVYCDRGISLMELGRFDDSLSSHNVAAKLAPTVPIVFFNRGNTLFRKGEYGSALQDYDRAIMLDPAYADAFASRGNVFSHLNRPTEALVAYDRALTLRPDLPDAWLGRGTVSFKLNRCDEALAAYDKALALKPDLAEAWLGRGSVLFNLKRYEESLAVYDKALALKPGLAEAWLGRGNVLFNLNRYEEALAAYDKALALNPSLADAWLGRGTVSFKLNRCDEALAACDKALALKPDLAEAWLGRGTVLFNLKRYEESLAAYDKAIALDATAEAAWLGRGVALFETIRLTDALAAIDKALSLKPDYSEALSGRIFTLDFVDDAGFEEQQKARQDWWQQVGASLAVKSRIEHLNSRDPARRIRVGYVSADFRRHSAAYVLRPVLLNQDHSQFEIICYSCSLVQDDLTMAFRQAADLWREAALWTDDTLCQQIQGDQVDILVDLSGHSAGGRLGVFARKPAPVQITAWGHATGTGLPTIDYFFADPVVCPPAIRHLFAEKVFDLPCLLTIDPLPEQVRGSEPPVLSKGYVTFGVFNRASKISEAAVAAWAAILQRLPRSQILMKDTAFDDISLRSRVSSMFAAHGISADRLAFLGGTPRADHLAAFAEVDISLDPFPQTGGVSAWESLQMGVPVVTTLGSSISSRVAGAIVSAVGLGEWVSDSVEDYLAIAVKFASSPEYLRALRLELPTMISESEAGNSAKYTRAVEAAYRKFWADYCRTSAN